MTGKLIWPCVIILTAMVLWIALTSVVLAGVPAERSPAMIEVKSDQEIIQLIQMRIDIDDVQGNFIEAYISDAEYELLRARGYDVIRIPNYAKLYADSLWEATKDSKNPMDDYHSYPELTAELQNIASTNPDICHLESIGQSTQGRELWFLKISDNVNDEEDEPEFKYISTMHGDEPVGTEMCLYLIQHIVDNYGIDSLITFLVDETEIWIMPMMNPDGNTAHTRYNANGEDLNRDFPDVVDPQYYGYVPGREVETQAVINWEDGQTSILSANFHTGALVVNYPWDCQYTLNPDDDLFIDVSLTYARLNPPMYNSSTFDSGITNGAQWYVIHGGMQDWNYEWMGCNEVTIELSNVGWPPASTLPDYWEDNRDAMVAYMARVHDGVRGLVTDSITGEPLNATITVLGRDHEVYTDPDVGDYHRMLLPGTYTLSFYSPGYFPKTISGVQVVGHNSTRLDVQLSPPIPAHIVGTVTEEGTGSPVYATVEVLGSEVDPVLTDSLTGSYAIDLCRGTYTMRVTAEGYRTVVRESVEVEGTITEYFQLESIPVHYYSQGIPLAIPDDDGWVTSTVVVPESVGIEDINVFLLVEHTYFADLLIDLASPEGTTVRLWNRSYAEPGSLFVWFDTDIAPDGPGAMTDFVDENAQGSWELRLRDQAGGDVGSLLQWTLEIYGIGSGTGVAEEDNVKPHSFRLCQSYPNPFNPSTIIPYYLPDNLDERVTLRIYNIAGQEVCTLISGPDSPGYHNVIWDGRDENGRNVASGVYIYQLKAGTLSAEGKALLLR